MAFRDNLTEIRNTLKDYSVMLLTGKQTIKPTPVKTLQIMSTTMWSVEKNKQYGPGGHYDNQIGSRRAKIHDLNQCIDKSLAHHCGTLRTIEDSKFTLLNVLMMSKNIANIDFVWFVCICCHIFISTRDFLYSEQINVKLCSVSKFLFKEAEEMFTMC